MEIAVAYASSWHQHANRNTQHKATVIVQQEASVDRREPRRLKGLSYTVGLSYLLIYVEVRDTTLNAHRRSKEFRKA
jgi:hypothetical protein